MESLLDSDRRKESLLIGQKKAKMRRIKNPSHRGRPIKNSGVYYTEHVLVDPETYEFLVHMKNERHEPIGAVISRLILKRKKSEGPFKKPDGNPVSQRAYIDHMLRTHKTFDEAVEAMKNDGMIVAYE